MCSCIVTYLRDRIQGMKTTCDTNEAHILMYTEYKMSPVSTFTYFKDATTIAIAIVCCDGRLTTATPRPLRTFLPLHDLACRKEIAPFDQFHISEQLSLSLSPFVG